MPTRSRSRLVVAYKRILAGKRFNDRTRWRDIRFNESVSIYFTGGAAALDAFAHELNGTQPFRGDRLDLEPQNIRHARTIGDIFSAIKKNYKDNGFALKP